MLKLDEILDKLEKATGYTRQQLYEKVLRKQMELSGLVSLEGAAYLVARDLNVNLLEGFKERRLKIGNVVDGMKKVNVVGRVFFISTPIEFEREDGSVGKVANIYIGDDTGFLRVTLWDKQVSLVEDKKIEVGDVVEVKNAMAKETKFGMELRLNSRSFISHKEGIELPSVEELIKKYRPAAEKGERVEIKDLEEGPVVVRGFVVQVFKTDFVYQLCPKCNKKLVDGKCNEHGAVEPRNLFVINGVLDDGTGYVRVVFFDRNAMVVTGLKPEDLLGLTQDERYTLVSKNILGKEFIITGVVKKNEVFERLELVAKRVEKVDVKGEIERLLKEVEKSTETRLE